MTKHIGIFGGTFDPVHAGHIRCASFVRQYCQLDSVRLMPCHLPPHRASPGVSAQQRADMVALAIAKHPALTLESLELTHDKPSYTVDSLTTLHSQLNDTRLYFIIGMDSLCYFTKWKNYRQILQLVHLLVCQRPGYDASVGDAPQLLAEYGEYELSALKQHAAGKILLLPNPLTDLSATAIRRAVRQGKTCDERTLDPAVLNYIQAHRLYLD